MENHPSKMAWKIPVIIFLAIALTVSLGLYFYQGNLAKVTIKLNGGEINLTSNANTLEELLHNENITFERELHKPPLRRRTERRYGSGNKNLRYIPLRLMEHWLR